MELRINSVKNNKSEPGVRTFRFAYFNPSVFLWSSGPLTRRKICQVSPAIGGMASTTFFYY